MAATRSHPGSIDLVPTVKRSISFDAELLAAAEAVAREATGGNLSALVGEALDRRVRSAELGRLLDEDIARIGGLPPDVEREVGRQWTDLERGA